MDPKQQIISKAADLFMRYGIKSVTMDDLARQLGISKKTLYEHVENKSDLITQIFEQKINEEKQMMAQFRDTAADAIEEILQITEFVLKTLRHMSPTAVYDLQKYYRSTWKMMESLHSHHIYDMIKDNLERGMSQGVFRDDINPDIIAKIYVGSNSCVTDDQQFPVKDYRMDQLFIQLMTYHMHGIASPKGLQLLEQHMGARSER